MKLDFSIFHICTLIGKSCKLKAVSYGLDSLKRHSSHTKSLVFTWEVTEPLFIPSRMHTKMTTTGLHSDLTEHTMILEVLWRVTDLSKPPSPKLLLCSSTHVWNSLSRVKGYFSAVWDEIIKSPPEEVTSWLNMF